MTNLFQFTDYKKYLNQKLDEIDEGGRGSRARLSRSIGCQTAYIAQVLRGSAHFNLEQGEAINGFLGHTEEQANYFLLILSWGKAATAKLKTRLGKQIEHSRSARSLLKNRLGVEEGLVEKDKSVYYSSWIFGAVHALVSVPGFQTPEKISKRLGIDLKQSAEAVDYLEKAGILIRNEEGEIGLGKKQIHLGADSYLITRHHLNWRLRAIQSIERDPALNLHYSSVISLSSNDLEKIRETLIETIQKIKLTIRDSKEEEVACWSMDFFRL